MIDVPRLRLLRTVVATGSIRASASALGYTPSAVSQQLAALQRETRLQLLERAGRGIEPTAAGRALAMAAEPLFQELSRVEGLVHDLRAGRVGSLSIGYFASAGAAWLPPVVAALRAEFPELRLDLRMTEFAATDRAAGVDRADPEVNIFVEGPQSGDSDQVTVRRIVDDPYVAVVTHDDPFAEQSEVPLADLAARRWVDNDVSDGPCRSVLLAACTQAGFSPEFAVETHDYRTAIPFVSSGIGITVLPALGVVDLPSGLTTVPVVKPTPVRHISVAVKKSVADHPAVLRVLELLDAAVTAGADSSSRAAPPPATS